LTVEVELKEPNEERSERRTDMKGGVTEWSGGNNEEQ
jgi:hypothetical protein